MTNNQSTDAPARPARLETLLKHWRYIRDCDRDTARCMIEGAKERGLLEREGEAVSPMKRDKRTLHCPYCSYWTHSNFARVNLRRHIATSHPAMKQLPDLRRAASERTS